MKGKIAFVLGAAVGYVLGTRAGRERYEQIKRGAQTVWNTPPVQRGVEMVRGAVDERAEEAKLFARRVVADVFSSVGRAAAGGAQPRTASERSAARAEEAAPAEKRTTAPTPKKSGSSPAKSSASKSSSSKGASSKGSASKGTKRSDAGQGE